MAWPLRSPDLTPLDSFFEVHKEYCSATENLRPSDTMTLHDWQI